MCYVRQTSPKGPFIVNKFKKLISLKAQFLNELTITVYVVSLLGYNICGTYIDAKKRLTQYRKGTFESNGTNFREVEKIKNEWDAVKYGASENTLERLWDSLLWPITIIKNTIPAIVLALNPNQDQEKKK